MAVILCAAILFTGCVPKQGAGGETPTTEQSTEASAVATESSETDGESVSAGGRRIAFINPFVSSPYMAAYVNAAMTTAEELGIELTMMDAEGTSQKAYDLAQSAISQKYDGIILLSPDTKSSISIVKMIEKAGIPLIISNARADESVQKDYTYVGADLEMQGQMAGEMTLEALGDKGGKICIIEGPGGHDAALSRSAGFKKAVEGKEGIEIIGIQQADWDRALAMQKMDDFLVQFPEIDVVFCHDDNMAIGAVEAAKAAGRLGEITIIGVGASIDGLEAIRNGEMYGTVLQAPSEEGSKSVQAIVDTMDGKELEKWIALDCDKITKENVDEYKGEW